MNIKEFYNYYCNEFIPKFRKLNLPKQYLDSDIISLSHLLNNFIYNAYLIEEHNQPLPSYEYLQNLFNLVVENWNPDFPDYQILENTIFNEDEINTHKDFINSLIVFKNYIKTKYKNVKYTEDNISLSSYLSGGITMFFENYIIDNDEKLNSRNHDSLVYNLNINNLSWDSINSIIEASLIME